MRTAFETMEQADFRFHGIMDESVKFVEDNQLLKKDLWVRFVQQFKENADLEDDGWRGEYWGKMMRGACFVYQYSKNPLLYQLLKETVEDMLSAQAEDGRISTYPDQHEFAGWDLWSRKYVLLGMQYFLEICKEPSLQKKIVESMCRQVDYLIDRLGEEEEGKILITKTSGFWRGLNSSSILEPIVRLYRLTKEQKYFDFASYIVKCGGMEVANVFELAYEDKLYPYQYPFTKAYEMTSCFDGLLEYYLVTREEHYKTAIINFANKILESDFTVIGSSGCTHELFDHSTVRQANRGKLMQETCVTVTLMKFFYRLNELTGNAKYADAFEISLYNAYLGSINTEKRIEPALLEEYTDCVLEVLPFDSYSPLTAGKRGQGIGGLKVMKDKHYYGCCACIGSMGLGLLPKMTILKGEHATVVNLYFDGEIQTKTPDGKRLNLHTKTAYPKDGHIEMTLELEQPEEFEIKLRIPKWSKKWSIYVDKQLYATEVSEDAAVEKGYASIKKLWKNGDHIELSLDMRTEILHPIPYGSQVLMTNVVMDGNYTVPVFDEEDPEAKNHVALRRGPIMLAQENRLGYCVDEPIARPVDKHGYAEIQFPEKEIAPYPHQLEVEVTLNDGKKMHVTDYASAGKLWTEESKMAVWMLIKN